MFTDCHASLAMTIKIYFDIVMKTRYPLALSLSKGGLLNAHGTDKLTMSGIFILLVLV